MLCSPQTFTLTSAESPRSHIWRKTEGKKRWISNHLSSISSLAILRLNRCQTGFTPNDWADTHTHTHANECPAGCVTASAALEKQEERVFITSSGREAGLQRGVCLLILCQLQQLQIVNPELAKVVLLSVFVLVCLAYKRPRFLFCQQIRNNSIPCFGTHCVM